MYLYWIKRAIHTDIRTEGYVGITNNPKIRLRAHKYTKQRYIVQNALKKYSDVEFKIIFEGSTDYCAFLENKFRPVENIGWNIVKGGRKPPDKTGCKLTEEHKRKISIGNKGKNVGKLRTPEMVAAMSERQRGKPAWNKGMIGIQVAWNKGKPWSDETKAKMSAARIGKAPWNKGLKRVG